MDYFSIFIISFTIGLSGALAPGPLLATVIYESAKNGFKAGPLIIFGHALLEMLMVALILIGLSRFIQSPTLVKAIFFTGALIFIYFGISMLRSLPKVSLDFKKDYRKSTNLIFTGIAMSIANPYWTIWWLTIGLGLVLTAQKQGLLAIGIFFSGHISADLGWYSLVSLLIGRGKGFVPQKAYKIMIAICAITLIGFGVYFGISAFSKGQ